MSEYRSMIRKIVGEIEPHDRIEAEHKTDVLNWIDSGYELCRVAKPATPPKHLVSYFVLTDGDGFLLVHHRNAQLWLPTGGHVDPGEHPRQTVYREAREELGMQAELLQDAPYMVTVTETTGRTSGHIDVSLWYSVHGDRSHEYDWDRDEFSETRWYHPDDIPYSGSDPHMRRFVTKMGSITP